MFIEGAGDQTLGLASAGQALDHFTTSQAPKAKCPFDFLQLDTLFCVSIGEQTWFGLKMQGFVWAIMLQVKQKLMEAVGYLSEVYLVDYVCHAPL